MFVGSVLAITWTHAVLSYRVNCCRRPVFEKKSGFNITINRRRLAVAAAPPPLVAGSANSIFLQHRHRQLANADSPMFQRAPMSPIFDVGCVHRPSPKYHVSLVTVTKGRCYISHLESNGGNDNNPSTFTKFLKLVLHTYLK